MTCEKCREIVMDAVYGEQVEPRVLYEFFQHLGRCPQCDGEYLELVGTREMLSAWDEAAGEAEPQIGVTGAWGRRVTGRRIPWWAWTQRVAAGFLILFGAFSMLRSAGVVPGGGEPVAEQRLREMVHDLVVARQDETLRVIGQGLLDIKEELEIRNRAGLELVYEDLYSLEQRYLQALEDNNRQVRRLISR
jgi:hypothetical protein